MIKLYQKYISPLLHNLLGTENACRFYPSCSDYTRQAIQKYGIFKGTYKGILRIVRCNPLFKGGFDYP
ncbi:MAG: membrane protein insertion efficiency factor YidD [bacterium]|nr:membrane protein insertion efficiency factor YidD [bacterium]